MGQDPFLYAYNKVKISENAVLVMYINYACILWLSKIIMYFLLKGPGWKHFGYAWNSPCQKLCLDPLLIASLEHCNVFNFLWYSRAVAQRCPSPPMLNLVSFGGQHQGMLTINSLRPGLIPFTCKIVLR